MSKMSCFVRFLHSPSWIEPIRLLCGQFVRSNVTNGKDVTIISLWAFQWNSWSKLFYRSIDHSSNTCHPIHRWTEKESPRQPSISSRPFALAAIDFVWKRGKNSPKSSGLLFASSKCSIWCRLCCWTNYKSSWLTSGSNVEMYTKARIKRDGRGKVTPVWHKANAIANKSIKCQSN